MTDEIWKPVPGYEGCYEISSTGRLRSISRMVDRGSYSYYRHGREIQLDYHGDYVCISLSKDKIDKHFPVHRLVAMAFLPNPEGLPVVNHKDGNKHNNNVENLEWCTYSQNVRHAYQTGLISKDQPRINGLKAIDVIGIRVRCIDTNEVFESIANAASYIDSYAGVVDGVERGVRSHGGKGWLFEQVSESYYQQHKNDKLDQQYCNSVHAQIKARVHQQGRPLPIYCVERDKHYRSRSAAARDNNMDPAAIEQAIKENRKAKGLTFIIDSQEVIV